MRSWPPPTASSRPSRAWETCVRRTSARAFAACRRSTSWTAICKPDQTTKNQTQADPQRGAIISEADWEQTIEVFERETPHEEYDIGDQVVYPHHGAGKILKKEMKEVLGEKRQYLTIKILHNDMTVMVPCENAGRAGLRRVIDDDAVKKVLAVLRDDVSSMPKN